jgi:type IV pilus modification protein PilV
MKVKAKQSGFSMIELLVSLTILAVGILAIANLQVAAIRTLSMSRHQTSAAQLANREMEWLRSLSVPLDPTACPTIIDSGGNAVTALDANNKCVLADDSAAGMAGLGDGIASNWHFFKNEPFNELGDPARNTDMKYFVRWTVERCCGLDPTGGYRDGKYNSGVLEIPGKGQIVIVMQVIWWESNKQKPAAVDLANIDKLTLKATHGHWIELTTIRATD